MTKEQQVIDYWSERIPTLEKEFEEQLIDINNDNSDFYKNENHRIYSLISHVPTSYFDKALKNKNMEELKLFFQTYNEFYKTFEGQIISTENIPNDLILDILYTFIFESIGNETKKIATKCMTRSIKQKYKAWLKSL